MRASSQPGPDRQRARSKGLDRLTAVTLGAAAASVAGAAGIGIGLYSSSVLASADATTVVPGSPANPNSHGSSNGLGPDGSNPGNANPDGSNPENANPDDSGQDGPWSQFQPGEPPSRSDLPPGATSGGS
jgi:hypothetical protein